MDGLKVRSVWVALLLVWLVLLAGCGGVPKEEAGEGYTVVDARGNEVYLPRPPRRILAANPGYDTILLGLVPPEYLAAVNIRDTDPEVSFIAEEVKGITPQVREILNVPLEVIIQTKPDLIIVPGWVNADHVESYRQLGYPVLVCSKIKSMETLKENIRLIAQALRRETEGERIIAEMDRQLAEADAVLATLSGPKPVGILVSQMKNFGGTGSMYDVLCTRARIENGIAKLGLKNGEPLSKELVVKANPDFFLVSGVRTVDLSGAHEAHQRFLSDPALAGLPALQNIRIVPDRYIYCASQQCAYSVKAMANAAYGRTLFDLSDEHLIKGYE